MIVSLSPGCTSLVFFPLVRFLFMSVLTVVRRLEVPIDQVFFLVFFWVMVNAYVSFVDVIAGSS